MSEFAEYAPGRGGPAPPLTESDGLRIRAAAERDLARLAPIAAEREGCSLEQALEGLSRFFGATQAGRALLVLAEIGTDAIGFGKASTFTPPAGSPPNMAPGGWYLSGVVVSPPYRRRGVGARLTTTRLAWIAELGGGVAVYYFANARNRVSIDFHRAFGFTELTRDFSHPHARFEGGPGILFIRRGPTVIESLE